MENPRPSYQTITKPQAILHAQWALSAWAAWLCLFGIYQSYRDLEEFEALMATQFQGLISISATTMMQISVACYALIALSLVLVILKIGQGKNWARLSILVNLIFQALWTMMPSDQGLLGFLPSVPDLGLQTYALYLLYTADGRTWFNHKARLAQAPLPDSF